jgi:hypothetical protein
LAVVDVCSLDQAKFKKCSKSMPPINTKKVFVSSDNVIPVTQLNGLWGIEINDFMTTAQIAVELK